MIKMYDLNNESSEVQDLEEVAGIQCKWNKILRMRRHANRGKPV
jgi:hypothetical protein